MHTRLPSIGIITVFLSAAVILPASAGPPAHGISHFGELKYPKDFPHFDYANPDAPKGGKVRLSVVGSFNNLHPYVDKGTAAAGINSPAGSHIYDPVTKNSEDEVGAKYGNLAESIQVADDYSWIAFTLRKNAYWHDGVPVTVEDALWTFKTLKTEASAIWRVAYGDFSSAEKTGPRTFRFNFAEGVEKTRSMILDSTTFTILPKHYWEGRKFNSTTLEPPLGCGPYRIKEVDPGHRIVYERVEDYWGKDLNVNVGHYNFDEIEYLYFLDKNLVIQALKANIIDYRVETNEDDFATAYNFWGYENGLFVRERIQLNICYGMNEAIGFNVRRKKLSDVRVREALALAYNFEWSNRVLWHDGKNRNDSYFVGTGLAATGLPSAAELELLEPYRGEIPDRVFTQAYTLPVNEPYGRNREALLRADALLESAGWVIRDFKRVNRETGEPLTLEFIITAVSTVRTLTPYVETLKRLGIDAKITRIEINLKTNRLRRFDFDAIVDSVWLSNIPIPSWMRSKLLSRNADQPNSWNYVGVKSPAVDELVRRVIAANTEEEMNVAGQALDRILLWEFYHVPGGYPKGRCFVYWDRFGSPPTEGLNWNGWPQLWWMDEEKSARVDAGIAALDGSGE